MVTQVLNRRVYYPGDFIFQQGDSGDAAYLIQTGRVRIFKPGPIGDIELGELVGGAIFGEMAMIDEHPRMASAQAIDMTTIIYVNRVMFQKKMTESDPFLHSILLLLVKNARGISEMLGHEGDPRHL